MSLLGVPARHACGGDVLQPRGAARRHHAPLRAGQLGEPLADGVGQFVYLHVVPRRRIHRGTDLGTLHGSADDCKRPAAVDDRFNADRLVDLRSGLERTDRGRPLCVGFYDAQEDRHGEHVPDLEQLTPRDTVVQFFSHDFSCFTLN